MTELLIIAAAIAKVCTWLVPVLVVTAIFDRLLPGRDDVHDLPSVPTPEGAPR